MTTPRRNRIDLHTHTSRSDGVLPPLVLHEQMQGFGMALVAVTDHDTLEGFAELRDAGLALDTPSPEGPQLVPGVEINVVLPPDWAFSREEIHIVGLVVDPDDERLNATLDRQRRLRTERFELMLERLRGLGIPIDEPLGRILAQDPASLGRPHVARALIALGLVSDVEEAFERYLMRGRPGYVPRMGVGPREAIEAIRSAGGVAVLAHYPHAPERPEVIDLLESWGLDGIEVHYFGGHREFDAGARRRISAFAQERGLLASGGTDYHGDTMSYADAQAGAYVPDDVAERLLEAIESRRAAAR